MTSKQQRAARLWNAAKQPMMELFVLCGCMPPQLSESGTTAFFTKDDGETVYFTELDDAFRYGFNYLIENCLMLHNPAWGFYRHSMPENWDKYMSIVDTAHPPQ